ERHQVISDAERCRARADARAAFAVLLFWNFRKQMPDLASQVGRDSLEAADCYGLSVEPSTSAGRLAWPVACASEDAREDVRVPVDHVGVGIAPLSDQADVLGDVGMRGAGPLAIDNLVEEIGRAHV